MSAIKEMSDGKVQEIFEKLRTVINFEYSCPKCGNKIMRKEGNYTCVAFYHDVTKRSDHKDFCKMTESSKIALGIN